MVSHKNIVVTGASSGIGKSIMDELVAQEGNRILAVCRHSENITGYGDNVIPFSCDLSTKEGVDALFARAEELFDKIDLYFCNAGAPYYERFDYEDWDRIQRIFDLNTVGHIYTYSKYLHHLNGREGRLVYTISAMGEMALPGYALYAATKFAMKGFQQAIRDETPDNLKISCVYPVSTRTNFFMRGVPAEQVPDEGRPARQGAVCQGAAEQAAPLRQAHRKGAGRHRGRHQAPAHAEVRRESYGEHSRYHARRIHAARPACQERL